MYVIVDGEVRVLGSDEQELAVRGPGDFIGEMAVISSKPRAASLLAKSAVHVLELRKPAFEAILRERPETALAMMRVLCEWLASSAHPRASGVDLMPGARLLAAAIALFLVTP
jgi:CRP/FNR family cyclic AMP-dependent transcriptional regulator